MMEHDTQSPNPWPRLFGVALACAMIIAIGAYAVHSLSTNRGGFGICYEQENPPGDSVQPKYPQWEKPLVAVVLRIGGRHSPWP